MSNKSCSLKHQQKVFLLHLNSASSCCRAYPETLLDNETIQDRIVHWKKESDLLDQGVELANCEPCWKNERQGKVSYRQLEGQVNKQSNQVELYLSNLCNQMCSYCSPKYSSMWEQSIDQQGMFKIVSDTAIKNLQILKENYSSQTRLDEVQSYIQSCADNSVRLELVGGEPLMQIKNLQKLLSVNCDKIKALSIVTNLNPPKPKFLKWMLDTFPKDKLHIRISLDATPEYNHIPRAGFDPLIFQKNITQIKKYGINVEFLATVSATSIFDLPNFLAWIHDNQYSSKFYLLNNPDCLNPEVVPIEVRQNILKNIKTEVPSLISTILNHQSSKSMVDLKLFEQYNYLTQYFDRTNTDLTKVDNPMFQQYWQWLTEKFKK
jgi:organic radical activating enzyme